MRDEMPDLVECVWCGGVTEADRPCHDQETGADQPGLLAPVETVPELTHDDAAFCFHCGDFVALIAHPQPVAHEECMGDLQVEMALAFLDEADWEPHFCDFPLCPCDANQNRLVADSADYYAQDRELEARMGWEVGTI
jgi:hypothetical protein